MPVYSPSSESVRDSFTPYGLKTPRYTNKSQRARVKSITTSPITYPLDE